MTFEKIKTILAEHKDLEPSDIKLESTFADLGFDSLDTIELIMVFEEEFGTTLEMNDGVKTVGDVVNLIDEAKK
ncbi:MAG: acyl carrier protein [Clostridiales bacterium]|nr:acyl carrier protein [Clostridiales bacterium]